MSQCAKCAEALLPEDTLQCCNRKGIRHFVCGGMSESSFRKLSKARKEGFKCIDCKAKKSDTDPQVLENKTDEDIISCTDVKTLFNIR